MSNTTTDPNDFLFQSGAKSAFGDDAPVGTTVKGRIISAEVRQQSDPKTGELKTWADGSPKNQLVITLQTDQHDDDNDDGTRAIYGKGGRYEVASGKGQSMLDAIREAVKKSGAKGLDVGAVLTVQHSGLGKKTNPAFNPPKLYLAKYEPATTVVEDLI